MKVIKIICILFLSLVIVNGSEESESLRLILDKSITPSELREDILAQKLTTWSGLKTIAGVEAVYDLRINTTKGDEKLAGGFISKRFEVPRNEVTTFLLGKCEQSESDTYLLMRYLDYLSDYDDDVRVPKYYASLLSDKRRQNRKLKPMDGCDVVRVCDIAVKNLTYWAVKKKLLKLYDPAFVWDALHVADFEHNIIAIQPYLVKVGVIEDSNQSGPNDPDDLQPTIVLDANEAVTEKSKAPESTLKSTPNQQTPSSATWSIIVVLTVAVLGFLWLVLKRRS